MKRKMSVITLTTLALIVISAFCVLAASFAGDSWNQAWSERYLPPPMEPAPDSGPSTGDLDGEMPISLAEYEQYVNDLAENYISCSPFWCGRSWPLYDNPLFSPDPKPWYLVQP